MQNSEVQAKSEKVQAVLDILQAEIDGDVEKAISMMHQGYSQTWMYKGGDKKLFPRWEFDKKELAGVYNIKGREYDIKNITENDNVVMVEMVESYPDPETKKVYRTPEVIVVEFRDGKIVRGRHYCDPRLSHMFLSKDEVEKAYE